jgi:hypothetical protein
VSDAAGFTIAAVAVAAFGGPTWAWVLLGVLAIALRLAHERAN